jgi:signal transduction histidine kinase
LPFFKDEKLEYIILSGVDISELNKVQKDLLSNNVELQKVNSELDNFVYRVSHDLRSPLLSIKGLISLIDYNEVQPASLVEYIKLIDSSASRMDYSIQDILEYSRNSRLEVILEEVDIRETVYEIFNDTKYSADTAIDLIYESDIDDVIITDKFRMRALLKNLIGNSVKYKNKNQESFVKFTMTKKNKMIVINIVDNGQGIDKENMPRVFEMFYRGCSESVGSGLGLYISKEIIEKLNGTISLKSKKTLGTEINIKLPVNKL